jgi:hypothetical protein
LELGDQRQLLRGGLDRILRVIVDRAERLTDESLTMPASAGWENASVGRRSRAAMRKEAVASACCISLLRRHVGW